ncbi:MAG: hypothetical protein H6719_10785 [Sandaracinaceae bacterium]|nr:hypothetical protein [Sandaracinaceae bacterium]
MRRGAAWVVGFALLASGCIDTELGLDAVIDSSRVTVAPDGVVTARLETTYRVGEHAEGDRLFQPNGIELYVGDVLVARMVPTVPPTFVQRVSPGESRSSPILGMDTMATDPSQLCGATVTVLFRWLDASTMEIGMTQATTSDVTCE